VPDQAAFLKGINLGKRRLSNDELRGHIEAFGLADAAVFRASGNVVFADPESRREEQLETLIEDGLKRLLGYEVATFVRNRADLLEIAGKEPFDAATQTRLRGKLQVMLLGARPSPATRKEALALSGEGDALTFGKRELYWLPAGGMSDSSLDLKALDRLLGAMTIRTMGTIEQIASKHFAA
jgi:uncharacterized protein (DUF1697 family)